MSEPVEYGATAKVVLTIEVPVRSSWGGNCSVEQVHRQALKDAVDYLEALREPRASTAFNGLRIIGEPEVTAVFVKRART